MLLGQLILGPLIFRFRITAIILRHFLPFISRFNHAFSHQIEGPAADTVGNVTNYSVALASWSAFPVLPHQLYKVKGLD